MGTLIESSFCPSELSNVSAIAASEEGQVAVIMNDSVLILVSFNMFMYACIHG